MYSNVIILTIFVFAPVFAIAEMPNILENVLAQQQPGGSQQQEDSSNRDRIPPGGSQQQEDSSNRDRIPPGTEDPTSRGDRIHDDQRLSISERDNQNSDVDSIRDLNTTLRDINRTSEEEVK